MSSILSTINSPQDIKRLNAAELAALAEEIREFIISTVAITGGHLAPSLGVVELTLVLHYLFNTPKDKLVWDVGHQAYAHKIITERRDVFHTIRQYNGISGFPKISESRYDAFGVGHASTAISAGYGIACARDIAGEKFKVISIVGDGALTGGLAFEGLNNAGASDKDFIVILNDNSMSISPNVGAISKYLTTIISNPLYNKIKTEVWELTGRLAKTGSLIRRAVRRIQYSIKSFLIPGILFERLGFRYFGPVDGHNIPELIALFTKVRDLHGPIVVHVLTKKGKGFEPAEKNASIFHGLGQFDPVTGAVTKNSDIPTYTSVFGKTLNELGAINKKIVTITGAMALGTGLSDFAENYPNRFFDVGIAEGHAVTFAAGLATQGYKPVVAIYSSFLQRSYDQIIHDVTLQKLPVIFALDRAGIVGDDGPTHHGVFDLAFLRTIPGLTIMAPADEEELRHMLYTAVNLNAPVAIRYPRGNGENIPLTNTYRDIPIGTSQILRQGNDAVILAVGHLVHRAVAAAEILSRENNYSVKVINPRFIKPVDQDMLSRITAKFNLVITLEEGTIKGGFGSEVAEFFADNDIKNIELVRCGIPDAFVEQGDRNDLLSKMNLDVNGIVKTVRSCRNFKFVSSQQNFQSMIS